MSVSRRIVSTERPYIEDVLQEYASDGKRGKDLVVMALGSSHWGPPEHCVQKTMPLVLEPASLVHRYGSIMGLQSLRDEWVRRLVKHGYSRESEFDAEVELGVTVGAQQAFMNMALILCDQDDEVVLLAPYYFSHKLALQIAGLTTSSIHICNFEKETMKVDWNHLTELLKKNEKKPKMLVLTSPNNPSGAVYLKEELLRMAKLCKEADDCWLVIDETYYEFIYDDNANHYFVTHQDYENVVHVLSMSKSFGVPGWRVGAVTYPKSKVGDAFRKIQDTNPTHPSILSQQLAFQCLRHDEGHAFVRSKVKELEKVRGLLWEALEPLGMKIKPVGAFYFLVPLPDNVTEDLAIDILAKEFNVLLLHGWIFGARGYLRLSFGSIPPAIAVTAIDNIKRGFAHLKNM